MNISCTIWRSSALYQRKTYVMGGIVLGQGVALSFGGQLLLHRLYLETIFICIKKLLAHLMSDLE